MAAVDAAGGSAMRRGDGLAALARAQTPLVLLIWAVYAAVTAQAGFAWAIEAMSTDDAMRLVEVRDLLSGQSWFDLIQHRLNPPDGVPMHWSRIIDLPIALTLSAAGAIFPPDFALRFTLTAWPLLLLLPALLACASASRALAGPAAASLGALLMVMSPGVTNKFGVGALDHHGAQIALALIMLACALRIDRSARAGVGAGLCCAVMLAIGMETLPHVAACAAFVALRWGVEGEPVKRGATAFGLSFAIGTLGVAILTVDPAMWLAPVCDALGSAHLVAAGLGGLGLAVAARFVRGGLLPRFAALAQIGVAVVLGVALIAPECLAAPYAALPERLKDDWLVHVQEAKGFFASTAAEPTSSMAIGFALAGMIAVAVWALAAARREERWRVGTAVALFFVSCGVTLWQIRGVSLAFAFGAPLLPMAVLAIGRGGGWARTMLAAFGLAPATLALAGLGVASAAGLPAIEPKGESAKKLCQSADYRALDALPKGLALNTIDTGPFILAHSRLSAVAAPYHRNVDGLIASLDAFDGTEEAARAVAISRHASYVVVCTTDGGVTPSAKDHPEGFSAKLLSANPPDWLDRIELGGSSGVKAWRVLTGR